MPFVPRQVIRLCWLLKAGIVPVLELSSVPVARTAGYRRRPSLADSGRWNRGSIWRREWRRGQLLLSCSNGELSEIVGSYSYRPEGRLVRTTWLCLNLQESDIWFQPEPVELVWPRHSSNSGPLCGQMVNPKIILLIAPDFFFTRLSGPATRRI